MDHSYDVVISLEHRVPLQKGWGDIIQHYRSRIVQNRDGEDVLAGTFDFHVVNVSLAIDRGTDIVDVADSIDQDLYDYCETLFEPRTAAEWREEVIEQFGDPTGSRLLVLHLAKVLPAHRGKHLALVAAHKIIEQFGDGLVIAKTQPLQHHEGFVDDKEMRYETFEKGEAAAMKRLERHWHRLGFDRIGDSEYLGLSTSDKLPEPKLVTTTTPRAKSNRTRLPKAKHAKR